MLITDPAQVARIIGYLRAYEEPVITSLSPEPDGTFLWGYQLISTTPRQARLDVALELEQALGEFYANTTKSEP